MKNKTLTFDDLTYEEIELTQKISLIMTTSLIDEVRQEEFDKLKNILQTNEGKRALEAYSNEHIEINSNAYLNINKYLN